MFSRGMRFRSAYAYRAMPHEWLQTHFFVFFPPDYLYLKARSGYVWAHRIGGLTSEHSLRSEKNENQVSVCRSTDDCCSSWFECDAESSRARKGSKSGQSRQRRQERGG